MLFDVTRRLLDMVNKFCAEMSLYLNVGAPKHTRLACRYLIAAVLLFCFDVRGENGTSAEDWDILKRYGLIKDDEQEFLKMDSSPMRAHMMLQWSCMVTRDGHQLVLKNKKVPGNVINALIPMICTIRALMQEIQDVMNLPIPFQYFHLLNVMLCVNFFLWGYVMAITASIFAPVTYFFAVAIFIGMMELSSHLTDPFGDDDTDFPLGAWMEETLSTCVLYVEELVTPIYELDGGEALRKAAEPFGDRNLIDLRKDEESHLVGKKLSKHGSIMVH